MLVYVHAYVYSCSIGIGPVPQYSLIEPYGDEHYPLSFKGGGGVEQMFEYETSGILRHSANRV